MYLNTLAVKPSMRPVRYWFSTWVNLTSAEPKLGDIVSYCPGKRCKAYRGVEAVE